MDTRSIITSQPAVACDVCGRTLLRGEQPDAFLAGGQRRMVCELCVNRATQEGWLREGDSDEIPVRPARRRRGRARGRGLMGRLRDLRDQTLPSGAGDELLPLEPDEPELQQELQPSWEAAEPDPEPPVAPVPPPAAAHPERRLTPRHVRGVPANSELRAARALEVFNLGEGPRRMAGVARSLGAPYVAVRPLTPTGSVVSIVVAWELCWYRYEVDLSDEQPDAQLSGQGMELDELAPEDRAPNAQADERGELYPLEIQHEVEL